MSENNDFFASFFELKNNNKENSLISNTNYIEWLKEFTLNMKGFYTSSWDYSEEELSEFDRKRVEKLNDFYDSIYNYATNNYIYPNDYSYQSFYKVRLDNFGFEIGFIYGQGIDFFFRKVDIVNEEEFIDFNDVMNNKKQDNVDEINAALYYLSNYIKTAYESGIPLEAIQNAIDITMKRIEVKEDTNVLTRKK